VRQSAYRKTAREFRGAPFRKDFAGAHPAKS